MGEHIGQPPEDIPRMRSGFLEHTIAREFNASSLGIDNNFGHLDKPEGRQEMLDRVREGFAHYARTVMFEVPPVLRPEHQLDNPLVEIRYKE